MLPGLLWHPQPPPASSDLTQALFSASLHSMIHTLSRDLVSAEARHGETYSQSEVKPQAGA